MHIKACNLDQSKDYFERLYQTAFPKDERIDLDSLYEFYEKDLIDIIILKKDEQNIGIAVVYLGEGINLLSYYAIDRSLRARGYGSLGLKLLKEKYNDLIIEIESTNYKDADDYALRTRRKAFYIKNGFKVMDYSINYFGIEMELMATTKDAGLEEYFDTYLSLFDKDYVEENIKLN